MEAVVLGQQLHFGRLLACIEEREQHLKKTFGVEASHPLVAVHSCEADQLLQEDDLLGPVVVEEVVDGFRVVVGLALTIFQRQ